MQIPAPQCVECRWLQGPPGDTGGWKCKAFPCGIPAEIVTSQRTHIRPYPGDGGIRFEPADGTETE